MRDCLLSCAEQALYDKSVEKRLNELGDELRTMGDLVSLRVALLNKATAKNIRDRATLRLKARAVLRPEPCCNKYYEIHEYTFCPECGEEME